MRSEKVKKLIKRVAFVSFVVVFFVGIICLYRMAHNSPIADNNETEADVNGRNIGYFNGEILEVTEEYLYVKPTEWEWDEVARVKIPLQGEFKFDSSRFQCGDKIRVPFNSNYMEWGDDEVYLSIIFQIYIREE